MDAKHFGTFISERRRMLGLTQAEVAARLYVTDKAVSRWERGIGLPDINTLEPLAEVLRLTLDELIHAGVSSTDSDADSVRKFVDLFSPQSRYAGQLLRAVCLLLSVLFCLAGLLLCPGCVAVLWDVGTQIIPVSYSAKPLVFPVAALLECPSLYFWHFCDTHMSLWETQFWTWFSAFQPRVSQFIRLLRETTLFFLFGFLVPFCELFTIVLNLSSR